MFCWNTLVRHHLGWQQRTYRSPAQCVRAARVSSSHIFCQTVFFCKREKIETNTEEGITKENFGATKVNPASYILIPDGGYLKTLISPDTSIKESHHQNTQTPSKGGIAVKFTFLCYFAKECF